MAASSSSLRPFSNNRWNSFYAWGSTFSSFFSSSLAGGCGGSGLGSSGFFSSFFTSSSFLGGGI
jgi:hypothetical protein